MRQIFIDTETTGLDPKTGHRIIEIAAIEVLNRNLTGKTFHRYLNPQRAIETDAVAIHGLTEARLAKEPLFRDIVDDFLLFIQGAELIMHNAPFDMGFITTELELLGLSPAEKLQSCVVTDTLNLARKMHPGQHNSLDALCRRYHVDRSNRQLHGALIDAELLARVYLLMTGGQIHLFDEQEIVLDHHLIDHPILSIDEKNKMKQESLTIVYANAEELKAHEDFLNKMREK